MYSMTDSEDHHNGKYSTNDNNNGKGNGDDNGNGNNNIGHLDEWFDRDLDEKTSPKKSKVLSGDIDSQASSSDYVESECDIG